MKGDLAHEYKKGNNGQIIRRKNIPDIPGQKIQSRIKIHHIAESDESQKTHGEPHRHFRIQKDNKDDNSDDSNG
jgi:hypothetical protein